MAVERRSAAAYAAEIVGSACGREEWGGSEGHGHILRGCS